MRHRVVLSTNAQETFNSFQRPRKVFVGSQLLALADDPLGQSRPSAYPYLPGYLVHEFDEPKIDEFTYYRFSVHFNVRQVDLCLLVAALGHYPLTSDPEYSPFLN
jgi:hypothetical protein